GGHHDLEPAVTERALTGFALRRVHARVIGAGLPSPLAQARGLLFRLLACGRIDDGHPAAGARAADGLGQQRVHARLAVTFAVDLRRTQRQVRTREAADDLRRLWPQT